jgi:predicted translin family RNA/ssDNA-binding protein
VARRANAQNERRERLIILSRSITQLSKKLIFHLHRGATSPPHIRVKTITEGKGKEREILANFGKIKDELGRGEDAASFWRWARPVSPGMEEYIEATSFLYYLDTGRLIPLDEVQRNLSDPATGEPVSMGRWCGWDRLSG